MWSRWRYGWVIMTSGPTPDFTREFPWGHRREAEEDGHWQAKDDDGRPRMLPRGLGVRAMYRPTGLPPVSPGRVDSLM